MPKPVQLILGALVLSACAFAQVGPPDSYQVAYAGNFAAGDSVVNMTNAGSIDGADPLGDICANIYTLAQDQQVVSCCTCPLTPNHLRTLSVKNDLISNTLTPGVPTGVTIALIASGNPTGVATACNAATVNPANLKSGLRAWATTLHAAPGGGFAVTENAFLPALLSTGEFAKLTSYCNFIQLNGSTFGICGSCRDGAAGASHK